MARPPTERSERCTPHFTKTILQCESFSRASALEADEPSALRLAMNKKFRRYDHRHKEAGGGIKKPQTRLFANICQMPEIPRYEIINFVK